MIRRPVALPNLPQILAVTAAALMATGCGTTDVLSSDKVDYRSSGARTVTLDVPPDLSQLPADVRFGVPQGAPVSASQQAAGTAATTASNTATQAVAPAQAGNARLQRAGDQRWIATTDAPEQIWPRLVAFWKDSGFEITVDDKATGVIETGWAENRAKIPMDFIRSSIGRLFEKAYDSGERDRFIMRIERTAQGSEIRIAHRGMEEVYTSPSKDATKWQPRASDSELEAIMLSRVLVHLGGGDPASAKPATGPATLPARARLADPATPSVIQVDDALDVAWRRVSGTLDRAGYVSHERDRRAAKFLVSAPPNEATASDKPGFFSRMFGDDKKVAEARKMRVQLKEDAGKTVVSIFDAAGQPDSSAEAKALSAQLLKSLQ